MLSKYNDKVVSLVDKLLEASKAYYAGKPIISDAEYDSLENQLRQEDLSNKFFDIVQTRQFTDKVYHSFPMLSQQKALSIGELSQFLYRFPIGTKFAVTHKLDGMSIEICVRDHKLTASSRGDGEYGEDYTEQVKTIIGARGVLELENSDGEDLVIRGECILTKDDFEALNARFISEGKPSYANSRNGVCGIFNNVTDGALYLDYVTIYIYDVLTPTFELSYSNRLNGLHEELSSLGIFRLRVLQPLVYDDINDLLQGCERMNLSRASLDYTIDGLVVRVNDQLVYDQQGRTSKFRKGSIAYKFPAQQGTVVIRNIEWSMGSRDITPVAIFDEVVLSGARITRANLHSVKNMLDLGATVGSVLILTRQGDVIPKLSKDLTRPTLLETGQPVSAYDIIPLIPQECPACKSKLHLSADNAHLFCHNTLCQGKLARKIEIFAKAIGIDFIGEGVASALATRMTHPIGLLSISRQDLDELLGVGVAARIYESISAVKLNPVLMEDFVSGLALPRLGLSTVRNLFLELGSENCLNGTVDFTQVRGIGRDSHQLYKEAFSQVKKLVTIAAQAGLRFNTINVQPIKLVATYFCITGALTKTRADFIREMERHGWIFKSSISSVLKYLVCNDISKGSSKLEKARKYGIRIISDQEAYDISKNSI